MLGLPLFALALTLLSGNLIFHFFFILFTAALLLPFSPFFWPSLIEDNGHLLTLVLSELITAHTNSYRTVRHVEASTMPSNKEQKKCDFLVENADIFIRKLPRTTLHKGAIVNRHYGGWLMYTYIAYRPHNRVYVWVIEIRAVSFRPHVCANAN